MKKERLVLDSHSDTPLMLMDGLDLGKRQDRGHFDFIRMKEGGLDVTFFAIYTSNALAPDESTRRALQLLARSYDSVESNRDKVAFAFSSKEARENKAKGLGSVMLGMENGSPIQTDLSLLRLFYRMGVRYMTLTHAGNNEICDSCAPKEKRWGGVSPFGIEVIKEMNRLGMIVDCSHISDEAFYDALKYSKAPIVATHSCCRVLSDHPRNMTDQMIRDLAAAGGVIQINFYPAFLDKNYADKFWDLADVFDQAETEYKKDRDNKEKEEAYLKAKKEMFDLERPSYKQIVDHIDHVVKLVGTKHVGLGSDFDGIETTPEGLEDVSMLPKIREELLLRGYSQEETDDILGENFMRVLEQVEQIAENF